MNRYALILLMLCFVMPASATIQTFETGLEGWPGTRITLGTNNVWIPPTNSYNTQNITLTDNMAISFDLYMPASYPQDNFAFQIHSGTKIFGIDQGAAAWQIYQNGAYINSGIGVTYGSWKRIKAVYSSNKVSWYVNDSLIYADSPGSNSTNTQELMFYRGTSTTQYYIDNVEIGSSQAWSITSSTIGLNQEDYACAGSLPGYYYMTSPGSMMSFGQEIPANTCSIISHDRNDLYAFGGYGTYTVYVTLSSDHAATQASTTFQIINPNVTVSFDSNPLGVMVKQGTTYYGFTPFDTPLLPGEYDFSFIKTGYVSQTNHYHIISNQLIAVTLDAEPTPTPSPTVTPTASPTSTPGLPGTNGTSVLTIIQIVGNGSLEVYDNEDLIGLIEKSQSFYINSGHNVSVRNVQADQYYHLDKICDYNGCSADTTHTTLVRDLDFVTVITTFIANGIGYTPAPTPVPGVNYYKLIVSNNATNAGYIHVWLNGVKQTDVTFSMTWNLSQGTDVLLDYTPWTDMFLAKTTINEVVNTSKHFTMNQEYRVKAYWTENVYNDPNPTPGITPGQPGQTPRLTPPDGVYDPNTIQMGVNGLGDLTSTLLDALSPGTKMIIAIVILVGFGYSMGMPGVIIALVIDALIMLPLWLTILGGIVTACYFIFGRGDSHGE